MMRHDSPDSADVDNGRLRRNAGVNRNSNNQQTIDINNNVA